MPSYTDDSRRLHQQLTDAADRLDDLQDELDRTPVSAPGFQELRWLLDRQRETVRLIKAEIERNEIRKTNAVTRAVFALLREEHPAIFARLLTRAEHQVAPKGAQ